MLEHLKTYYCPVQATVWGTQLCFWLVSHFRWSRKEFALFVTARRLNAYSELEPREIDRFDYEAVGSFGLHRHGFQRLLGTLKKVEQKNAVALTILGFFLAAFLTVSFEAGPWTPHGLLVLLMGSTLVLPLYSSFRGVRHLDTFSRYSAAASKRAILLQRETLPGVLSDELLRDL
ncbi:hypothetical protein, partial [Leisingera sp. MMG026]|uniref:hypothetical protein n=1 Tax=Leisingera sp. MMG026 TaxID=2909982 RepID=UPI001F19AF07